MNESLGSKMIIKRPPSLIFSINKTVAPWISVKLIFRKYSDVLVGRSVHILTLKIKSI